MPLNIFSKVVPTLRHRQSEKGIVNAISTYEKMVRMNPQKLLSCLVALSAINKMHHMIACQQINMLNVDNSRLDDDSYDDDDEDDNDNNNRNDYNDYDDDE